MRSRLQRIAERRRQPRPDRRLRPPATGRPAPVPAWNEREQRTRESGGPEDLAVYTCACGYCFEAPVSTSVACPHCGAPQAW